MHIYTCLHHNTRFYAYMGYILIFTKFPDFFLIGEWHLWVLYSDLYRLLAGPVALSTPCKLISPGAVVQGTMSITKSELYFEMDEDDPLNKKIDPKVGSPLLTACTITSGYPLHRENRENGHKKIPVREKTG